VDDASREEVARLLRRGLNHYGLGDVEAAIGCWEKARKLDPDNRAAHDYLETAYEEVGSSRKATVDEVRHADPCDDVVVDDAARGVPTSNTLAPIMPAVSVPLADAPPIGDEFPSHSSVGDQEVRSALEHYKQGDLKAAFDMLERIAESEPERLDVQGYLVMIRSERAREWASEIGDQGHVLRRTRSMKELMEMNLRPDEGYLLSQIDGTLSIEELLSLSSMERVRTLEILARLLRDNLVA